MNTLFFLNSGDFALNGEDLTCTKTDELLFVLFYSTKCQYCGPAREVFNFVASQFNRNSAKFGIINVTQNPRVTQQSKASNTPIRYVPFLVAFFKGVPLAVFSTAFQQQNLVEFIKKCYSNIREKVDAFGSVKKEEEIPAYTVGIPYCEEGVCYLDFNDAYASAPATRAR